MWYYLFTNGGWKYFKHLTTLWLFFNRGGIKMKENGLIPTSSDRELARADRRKDLEKRFGSKVISVATTTEKSLATKQGTPQSYLFYFHCDSNASITNGPRILRRYRDQYGKTFLSTDEISQTSQSVGATKESVKVTQVGSESRIFKFISVLTNGNCNLYELFKRSLQETREEANLFNKPMLKQVVIVDVGATDDVRLLEDAKKIATDCEVLDWEFQIAGSKSNIVYVIGNKGITARNDNINLLNGSSTASLTSGTKQLPEKLKGLLGGK